MDPASLAIGFSAGVLATIAALGVLVFVKVRRALRGAALLRARLHPDEFSGMASVVETDAEGFIVPSLEES